MVHLRRAWHILRSNKLQPAFPLCGGNGQEKGNNMPQGDKSSYTGKQKRRAEHIKEGYKKRGVSTKEAKKRAWATVNKISGGGEKSGSGRGKPQNEAPSRKGGRKGGAARKRKSTTKRRSSKSK